MDVLINTQDTTKLASMPIPEFVEDVAKPAEGTPEADPETGDLPETDASKAAKQAVEGAPASPATDDLEAKRAAEEAARAKGEADKEHNFALLRAANKRLEAERDEAQRLLNESKAAEAPKVEVPPDLETMDAQIAELRAEAKRLAEEWPDMGLDKSATLSADMLQGVRNRIARDEQAVHDFQEAERKRAEDAAQDALVAAQEAADKLIEANPVLNHWKANDQASYDLAAEQDVLLRAQPAWQGVPMEKRFAAVIELVKAINPQASLPDPNAAPAKGKEQAKPAKEATGTGIQAAPIRSLSDVPGGLAAPQNELDNFAELSPAARGNIFMKMTREQQDNYLASLGAGITI